MKKRSLKIILLVLYMPLAVLLLLSLLAPYFNPAQWPFVAVSGLFFPVLWILNIFFLVVFILLRSKGWFFGLLFLLAGLYQVSLVFGMNGDDRENITGKTLKLLSYNTGNADSPDPFAIRRHVFEQKAFYRADVICLQEFIPGHARGSESLQRFEYHINVDFTGKTGSRANGLSIYSKFPILEQGFLKPEDEDVFALWVSLDLGTDTLLLINVQLQSIRLEDEEVEVVARPWRVPELFAIAGNVYRKFLGDAFLEQESGFGFTYAGPLPFLRIDFVMASEGLEVVSFERIGETFSDHFGLEAEFVFHRWPQILFV